MVGPQSASHSNPDLTTCGESREPAVTLRKRKLPDCDCTTAARELTNALKELRLELDTKLSKLHENIVDTIKADLNALRDTSLEIKNDISALRHEHSTFKQQISKLEESLQYHSDQQDDLKIQVDKIDMRTSSINPMGDKLSSLEQKMESLEQQARLNNIEICNLPEKRDEDLLTVMESVGAALKCPISRQEILSIHRVPHARNEEGSRPKNIIAKFSSRTQRNNIISAYRLSKTLKSSDIGVTGTSQNIYINEHLTLYNKKLFRECRDLAKKHNVKYVWIKNATILAKETDSSKTFAIRCNDDLIKITQCKQNKNM